MKKILIILSVIFILYLIFFNKEEIVNPQPPLKKTELTENNIITNTSLHTYYDTIISVGLDESNIKGVHIVVSELSEVAKEQFSGELQAHVRFLNGIFYLFIDDFDKDDAIDVISHEIIHIDQYQSGSLSYDDGYIFWNGTDYDLESIEYDDRPWERDAFHRGNFLSQKIQKKLIYR
jgi:predicted metallopeptidase